MFFQDQTSKAYKSMAIIGLEIIGHGLNTWQHRLKISMNINFLVYHLWDVTYVDLMEMHHLICAQDGIKLELYSHLLEITIKMLQSHRNPTDSLIRLELTRKLNTQI